VNYKVTSSIDGSIVGTTILPGMTANISVKVAEKSNALAVPQRAILEKEGKSFVRVVTNKDQGTFEEKEITTGLEADGGLVEVTSGLKTGDEIITFLEEKK
jgi:multidrug efflux pump subunit AcrA (membrane-fusion protein)